MLSERSLANIENQRKDYLEKESTKVYKSALEETRFHQLQYVLIQKQPKLLWKLKNALPIFFWLVSHVNRRDGSNGTVWAELDKLYRAGYLVTVRHIAHIAKEFSCTPETISRALNQLEEHKFLQIERNYTWGDEKKGWHHANLIILGYIEKEGEIWLYHTASKDWTEKENTT